MRNTIKAVLLGVGLVLALGVAPAHATEDEEPITASCEQGNVDCGDFPAPEDVPEGTECSITLDGVTYNGETNADGQCVCPDNEPEPTTTTSTTAPETTTTTEPEPEPTTTTTEPEPTTTTTEAVPVTTSTTLPGASAEQGGGAPFEYRDCAHVAIERSVPILSSEYGFSDRLDTDGDGVGCEIAAPVHTPEVEEAASGTLPRTGSNTPIVLGVGAGLVVAGCLFLVGKRALS